MALVSVVVPAYNAGEYLGQAVGSLLAQTYHPLEIVVVDDGSTDGTATVAQGFGDAVRYFYQENAGPSAARNTGVAHARGDLIAFLDADDAFAPERVAMLVRALEAASPRAAFAASGMWLWDGASHLERFDICRPPGGEKGLTAFLDSNRPYAGILARRRVLEEVRGFRPDLRHKEDCDLWLRILGAGRTFVHVAEPLYFYRQGPDGLSRDRCRQAAVACRVYGEAMRTLPLTLDQRRRLAYLLWRERARLHIALGAEAREKGDRRQWALRMGAAAAWQSARLLLRPHLTARTAWRRLHRPDCAADAFTPAQPPHAP